MGEYNLKQDKVGYAVVMSSPQISIVLSSKGS